MKRADKPEPSRRHGAEQKVVPVIEERVSLGKTVKEGRTVTVKTRPMSEIVELTQPLTHDRVTVERVAIGQVVTEVPPMREEGETTVIPVVEERVRVVVERVLVEEIHLRRTREESIEEVEVERRWTEVRIDD